MELGVFSKTFERDSLEKVLDAVKHYGFSTMQFNWSCAGLPPMPDKIPTEVVERIQEACETRALTIAAVSGTYNMIHPDQHEREKGLKRLEVMASVCKDIGTSVITLCTGSRSIESMWKHHSDNNTLEAWKDLVEQLEQAVTIAEKYKVVLGIEPEISNVINSAVKARQLLDDFQSKHLGIIMDAANIYHPGELPDTQGVLQKAFDLLGADIVMAHAKDVKANGEFTAAGQGDVDYPLYFKLLKDVGFEGVLIVHGQSEAETPDVVKFLKRNLG